MNYYQPRRSRRKFLCFLLLLALFATAQASTVHGTVADALGAVIPSARVELIHDQESILSVAADNLGRYEFRDIPAGRYQIRGSAHFFDSSTSTPFYVGQTASASIDLLLPIGRVSQAITVTETGTPRPEAQVGSSITVLSNNEYAEKLDILEGLRLVPGMQVTQTGQRGGLAELFVRGGNSDANKVLIDGIPANDIGGEIDFGTLASVGIDQVEVLRGPNSAVYGSDALAGVVSITTPRGITPLPAVIYSVEGGNFGTYRQEGTLAGSHRRFDYFSDFARFDTNNAISGNSFHNGTYTGNVGWSPRSNSELRATVRRLATAAGEPNAIQLYGIPDAAGQEERATYVGATFQQQTTPRWHNLLRYGALRLRSQFIDYAATGIPYPQRAPAEFIGAPVTLHGANGYTVSGQAFFQPVQTYPNQFVTSTDRDFVYAQTQYRVKPQLAALLGFRYEAERGVTQSTGFGKSTADRGNYSYTLQFEGSLKNRLYYTPGTGVEKNAIFGVEPTPRASVAYYLFRPATSSVFSGTKLRVNFGTGIKEPSVFDASNSLFSLLEQLHNGSQLISQFHVAPIGAERSRTYDGGLEQSLWDGRLRLGITYFHNQFSNLIEFVPSQGLIDVGVASFIANALQFGATVNSQSYRAQGAETEIAYRLGRSVVARGGYTYLDAVVQRSFSGDALGPSFNTSSSFATVPIGIFSPLIGARPFRRAPHSGYLVLAFSRARCAASLTGTFVGRRDDSDFLFDKDGGTSLLLPNRNLDAAYQMVDVGASYQLNHVLSVYADLQNVLDQHYAAAFGFPALPFTFRSGMRISLGGESWKLK